jgi:hypothetical protein
MSLENVEGICSGMGISMQAGEGCGSRKCFECQYWVPEIKDWHLLILIEQPFPFDWETEGVFENEAL